MPFGFPPESTFTFTGILIRSLSMKAAAGAD
jgi:hypothetical protein